jgi:hypothetical protein
VSPRRRERRLAIDDENRERDERGHWTSVQYGPTACSSRSPLSRGLCATLGDGTRRLIRLDPGTSRASSGVGASYTNRRARTRPRRRAVRQR